MLNTRRSIRPVFSTLLTVMWLLLSGKSLADQASIIFAADMPVIGKPERASYPQLATLLRQQRAEQDRTFFVFGGGSLGPSTMSGFDRGSHIIDILNTLEPDVMGVTKREFSYFEDELSLRSYEAAFPIVATNLFDRRTQANLDGLLNEVIVTKGNMRLGVVSILADSTVEEYLLTEVEVRDPEPAVEASVQRLRNRGANVIALLYSSPFDFIVDMLDQQVIDLALITDPHFEITANSQIPEHPSNIYISQPGQAAVIELDWSAAEGVSLDWSIVDLVNYASNDEVEAQIEGYLTRLDRLLNEVIGKVASPIDTRRPVVRARESAFGNFVADALRTFTRADIGLINGGIIRGEQVYQPGDEFTRGDVLRELPFRNRIALLDVTGQQLIDALENGFSQVENVKGRFPHLSGARVTFDPTAPVGARVKQVWVGDTPINPSARYRLVTSAYLASGGDGYQMFSEARTISLSGDLAPLIAHVVTMKIRQQQNIAPILEGRIERVSEN